MFIIELWIMLAALSSVSNFCLIIILICTMFINAPLMHFCLLFPQIQLFLCFWYVKLNIKRNIWLNFFIYNLSDKFMLQWVFQLLLMLFFILIQMHLFQLCKEFLFVRSVRSLIWSWRRVIAKGFWGFSGRIIDGVDHEWSEKES